MARGIVAAACLAVGVACGVFAFGSTAQAGTTPTVTSPFTDDVCLVPSDVTSALADPNGIYSGSPKCKSLCKRARADCIRYVKLAAGCQRSEITDDSAYAKQECEIEHEDDNVLKRECKVEIEHSARDDRSSALEDRNIGVAACNTWEQVCETSCPQ